MTMPNAIRLPFNRLVFPNFFFDIAMTDYYHRQPGTLIRITVGFFLIFFCAVAIYSILHDSVSGIVFGASFVVLFGFLLLLFHCLSVRVNDEKIEFAFGIGWIRKSILLPDIQELQSVKNRWYYGWGIRVIPGGWLFNVSGLDAVEIQLKNGRLYRIGTDQPQELLQAILTRRDAN